VRLGRTVLSSVLLLLVLMSVPQVCRSVGATASLRQFVTCKGIDEKKSPYEPVDVTDFFFTTDEKVNALLVMDNVQPPITASIIYHRPEGVEHGRGTREFRAGPVISYGVYLPISSISSYTGMWRVEAQVDGALISTIYFDLSPPGPRLRLVDASIRPGPGEAIHAGNLVTAAYTLQNVGVAPALKVEIRVADSPPDLVVVQMTGAGDLAPGSSGFWQVTMRPGKAGTFKVALNVFMNDVKQVFRYLGKSETFDRFTITLTVSLKPVFLIIKRVLTQPSAAEPLYVGDTCTITYVVENSGQMLGEGVEIRVVSAPPEIEVVQLTSPKDLQPSSTGEWQVRTRPTKPGIYEVYVSFYVSGEKVIFQVEGQAETIERFKITLRVGEKPFLQTYGLYIVLGLIVIGVLTVAILVMRRRGLAAPPAPSMPAPTITPPLPRGERFCVHCGCPMPLEGAFCPKCGAQQY